MTQAALPKLTPGMSGFFVFLFHFYLEAYMAVAKELILLDSTDEYTDTITFSLNRGRLQVEILENGERYGGGDVSTIVLLTKSQVGELKEFLNRHIN